MRILITGASGFIGSHLTQALCREHEVVACARRAQRLKQRFPEIEALAVDLSTRRSIDDWLPLLQGVDMVINAVGIIRETGTQTFEHLHHRAPCILFQASQRAGVKKIIQISALGSDETASSRYHLSKKAADDCLKQLDVDWIILKPSLVYGPGGQSAEFFKALAGLPWIPVVEQGEQLVQPIHIDDLTAAVQALLSPHAPARIAIDAVGPEPISLKRMLTTYRRWLGNTRKGTLPVPYALSLFGAKLSGMLGIAPITGETIQMLRRGNAGNVSTLIRATGLTPRSFDIALHEQPAQQADRWHARLFFLRPLLRLSIGLLWVFTGLVSLGLYPVEQSYALLAQVGIAGTMAPVALYSAALLDLALGIATLLRHRIQQVAIIQITLMIAYSVLISIGPSELWLHPFGPITKNIPLIVATLIMMALEKD
ncbi:MAG: SDR family oxidoreductase [Thiohalobacteraceae bacterium]